MYYQQDDYRQNQPKSNYTALIIALSVFSLLLGAVLSFFIFRSIQPERVPGSVLQKTPVNYQVADDSQVIIANNNLISMVAIEAIGIHNSGTVFQSGTGFIVDYMQDGNAKKPIIMTNYHVVGQADRIDIKLFDKAESFKTSAVVVGYDSEIDIALLRLDIDLQNVEHRVVEFGNSRLLQYGQKVIAIGNALGGGLSVTSGEISIPEVVQLIQAEGMPANGTTQHFIQTSAAINSGNSGGVLLNMSGNGQVIGINTYKLMTSITSPGQSLEIPSDNVGLAVPSNMAVAIMDYIKSESDNYKQAIGDVKSQRTNFEFNLGNVYAALDKNFQNVLKISDRFNGSNTPYDVNLRGKSITKICGIDINDFHQGIAVPSASIFQELSYYYGSKENSDLAEHPFYNLEMKLLNGDEEETNTIFGIYLQRDIPWLDELIEST